MCWPLRSQTEPTLMTSGVSSGMPCFCRSAARSEVAANFSMRATSTALATWRKLSWWFCSWKTALVARAAEADARGVAQRGLGGLAQARGQAGAGEELVERAVS
jgi:hypothetical protein